MFYKVLHNKMLIDLLTGIEYVRYLPKQKRIVRTDSQSANGIMGSDMNTVYHLVGRPYTFPNEIKSVEVVRISEEEYGRLSTEFAIATQENENLRHEMRILKKQLSNQNIMLELILAKLSN